VASPHSSTPEKLVAGYRASYRLGARRDPAPGCHSNQEQRMVTCRRNIDLERKLGVPDATERRGRGVNDCLCGSRRTARITDQRPDDGGDRTGGPTGGSAVQNQPLYFEGTHSGLKIDPGAPCSSGPWSPAAVDLTNRVVHPGAVITPSIPRQCTTVSVCANARAHSISDNKQNFLIRILSFHLFHVFSCRPVLIERPTGHFIGTVDLALLMQLLRYGL